MHGHGESWVATAWLVPWPWEHGHGQSTELLSVCEALVLSFPSINNTDIIHV